MILVLEDNLYLCNRDERIAHAFAILSNNKTYKLNHTSMQKIGRIKSWYIDPDDSNRRKVISTIHNYLLVTFVEGQKFYAALHDTDTDEDDAIALEIGEFELNGKNFNARFVDINGNTIY